MDKYCFFILILLIYSSVDGQQQRRFRAGFWNLENLFDTINNPNMLDDEFTPDGSKEWSTSRVNQKVNKLSKAIIAMGEWDHIALLGVCEVENDTILRKLIYHSPLKTADYGYIHHESNDARGIDVALIYQKDIFTPMYSQLIDIGANKRGILYAKGLIYTDTLHVFVNHWSSRRGGFLGSENNRIKAAQILKAQVDSLQSVCEVKILIMGDFNDTPDDESLSTILNAQPYNESKANCHNCLINLTYKYIYKEIGTLKFQGKWDVFDNIIVSDELINGNGKLKVIPESCQVFYTDQMVKEGKNGLSPNPTYRGTYYNGGFSDHLPVLVDFKGLELK